ncbi:MAG: hypothetical protein EOO53_20615 [Gammaproteobacteria bacterium]|nr:MAG: hypothetical protein EOO53_20615 [Gammaproteobacteria bacterium]
MEALTKEKVSKLVQHEIESMSESNRTFILEKLISPRPKTLTWEYGNEEEYEAWLFAEMGERNIGLVYCLGGFGAFGSPWGLIFSNSSNFGMDPGWYRNLKDLVSEWLI